MPGYLAPLTFLGVADELTGPGRLTEEGIAFYNEEMMLVSGLVDDAPHTRTVLCNFMRLRALRVTVDVGLATGDMSIATAAAELGSRVPMDAATAQEEAAFFAETPGQALTYQIGRASCRERV